MTTTLTRRNGRATSEPSEAPRRVERRVGLPSGRAVVGGLLMALAAVGTFLAYADATADDTIQVLVAARDLAPGQMIEAADVELVPVELPGGVRGLFGAVDAAVGRQVSAPVEAGEFLIASATVVPLEGAETLEVAISVPAGRAVGRLRAGERVDVFSTWSDEVTQLIAVDARVLEVDGGSREGLGGSDSVTVRLAVADLPQVEALVHAQAAGDVTIVRATIGSEVADLGREYRPRSSGAASGKAGAAGSDG
ncbi:MAG TPA: SAF domain-containing protein [Acidimicrobiales bacterium]